MSPEPSGIPIQNPFVGLRPFENEDSLYYFGRNEQVTALLHQLYRTRFLAVVGSSGSGKSSLVRAGLIPNLEAGFLIQDRDLWQIATMKPGSSPMSNLAKELLSSRGETVRSEESRDFEEKIRALGVQALLDEICPGLDREDANLLLIVDQFEELFRFGLKTEKEDEKEKNFDEAAAFVNILLRLAEQTTAPIFVCLTMRSDFLGDCDAFYGLPEAMNRNQYLVPRLTRKQRREAIVGPIHISGAKIAPRLADRLLNENIGTRDDLPILQHALMRTWETWKNNDGGPLDLKHYEAGNTVQESLNRHANEVLEDLSEAEQGIAKRLFQAITETDASNRGIRRPIHLKEISDITETEPDELIRIINKFRDGGRNFLILSSENIDDNPLVDISHESLIRQWENLQKWVEEEAESAKIYQRLAETAEQHQTGRFESYRGTELQMALRWHKKEKPNTAWAKRYHSHYEEAIDFLKVSNKKEQKEKEQKEKEKERKQKQQRLFLTVVTVLSLLIALISGFFFVKQKESTNLAKKAEQKANEQTKLAINNAAKAVAALDIAEKRRIEAKNAKAGEERARAETEKARAEAEKKRADEAQKHAKAIKDLKETTQVAAQKLFNEKQSLVDDLSNAQKLAKETIQDLQKNLKEQKTATKKARSRSLEAIAALETKQTQTKEEAQELARLKTELEKQKQLSKKVEKQLEQQQVKLADAKKGSSKKEVLFPIPKMVLIPAGKFQMGDLQGGGHKDEKPVHWVNISKPFEMGKYEVTFEEYDAFALATLRDLPRDQGWGRGRRPVINVSWDDAKAYIRWLNEQTGFQFRLPTEAEWEYAARAGKETKYPWGNKLGQKNANCDGCGSEWDSKKTAPVDSFKANAFDLHNTSGNVWEWVEDCWHPTYKNAPKDGKAWGKEDDGDCDRRVLRGGSWFNIPNYLRSAGRNWYSSDDRGRDLGFRLSRTLK